MAADLAENFVQQPEAVPAFKAFEKGGDEDARVVQVGEPLEEVASTLEDAQAAAGKISGQSWTPLMVHLNDIAREIARAHGGELDYSPTDDGLNAFTLSLPRS